jgi:serine phosphatase RsbU (regulator of sigma subunit)
MPLSYHDNISDFSCQKIKTKPNDIVYLFTDGYIDQFGGQEEKKFQRTQFKQVLLKNHKNPLAVQKEMLLDIYHTWKGSEDQVDDITVVGLKL